MFRILHTIYKDNRIGLLCAVLVLVYEAGNKCEEYIINDMALMEIPIDSKDKPTCPYPPDYEEDDNSKHSQVIYISNDDVMLMNNVRDYATGISFIIIGTLSDKYGGHRVGFLGFVISGLVMAVLYLSVLNNFIIFMLMFAIRRFSDGVVWAASVSLIGKSVKPYQIDSSSGIIYAVYALHPLLGYLLSRVMTNWMNLSYTCSIIYFTIALWWWYTWNNTRHQHIPKVQSGVPWRRILTCKFTYVLFILYISVVIIFTMATEFYPVYLKYVLHTVSNENSFPFILLMSVGCAFASLLCGITTDYFVFSSMLPASSSRKIFTVLGYITVFISVVIILLGGCYRTMGIAAWILSRIGFWILGVSTLAAVIEVIPEFSGTLYGLMLFVGYVTVQFLKSSSQQLFISEYGNMEQWQTFIVVGFLMSVLFIVPYLLISPTTLSFEDRSTQSQLPEMSGVDANLE